MAVGVLAWFWLTLLGVGGESSTMQSLRLLRVALPTALVLALWATPRMLDQEA